MTHVIPAWVPALLLYAATLYLSYQLGASRQQRLLYKELSRMADCLLQIAERIAPSKATSERGSADEA